MRGPALLLTMCWLAGPGLACGSSTSPSPGPVEASGDEVEADVDADVAPDVEAPDTAPDLTPDVIETDDGEADGVALDVVIPDIVTLDVVTLDGVLPDAEVTPLDVTVQDTQDVAGDADAGVEPTVTSLIDNTAWALVAAADDPFVVDGGPAPDLCPASVIQSEETPDGLWLDVSTEGCAWATLQQPLLQAVAAGEQVRVTVVHFEIYAGDTDYTLAVALGQDAETIWTETVELGAGFEVIEATVSPTIDHAQGAPIWYHVSNHGENTWSLVSIDLLVP